MKSDKIYIDIINYFAFLEKNYGFRLSVHYKTVNYASKASGVPLEFFLRCHTHRCELCDTIKDRPKLRLRCYAQQKRVAALNSDRCFFGMSYCGVEEFIMPIKTDNGEVGFISATGYCTDGERALRRLKRVSEEGVLEFSTLREKYLKLDPDPPDLATVEALLTPAADLLALIFVDPEPVPDPKKQSGVVCDMLFNVLADYIANNYESKLTVPELSKLFHYSESSINHAFRRQRGMNIRQYVNRVRIRRAQVLLVYSKRPVGRIALCCGFDSPAYFTAVFREQVGCTPSEYRRRGQSGE